MKAKQKALLICCVVLTAAASYTCIRIEVFNYQAGGYLPRNADADWGISTWRVALPGATRAAMEKSFAMQAEADGKVFQLTPEQEAAIQRAIERDEENAVFRDFVASFGLAQYLIAPLALILSLISASRRSPKPVRIVSGSVAVIAGLAAIMMFYRGYFSSLGW